MSAKELAALLKMWGFELIRQRGSHQQWRHPDGRQTTLPYHEGQDISPIMIRSIAKDIKINVEIFISQIKK